MASALIVRSRLSPPELAFLVALSQSGEVKVSDIVATRTMHYKKLRRFEEAGLILIEKAGTG